ncbi:MAG TPA: DsbA family protein [Acidimicrobiales bacterium]|nr:DsbA family protein [Acidimicrobiales bacterium]
MTTSFAVSWDYRCPFARIGHQHVIAGLRDGADWDVHFLPFSLNQMHVEEGQPDVWDNPGQSGSLLALMAGTVVRDRFPDRFHDAHLALFDARHVDALDLREWDTVATVLEAQGVAAAEVLEVIDSGEALATVRKEHEAAVDADDVWGVPTFVTGDRAVFVRLMESPKDDADGRRTVDRILDLLAWSDLNEFKATSIPR